MLDNEKVALKENAEELADLLTENIPYLLSHYLGKEILTESEREAIISAGAAQDIRIKLIETLADKEEVSLDSVIEGLNATENHRVSARISSILPEKKPSDDDGSGDKGEDVSLVATSLVDEVIAKAEDTTNSGVDQEQHEDIDNLDQHESVELNDSPDGVEVVNTASTENSRDSISQDLETPEENVEEESIQTGENLVEASVEVHKMDEETAQEEDIPETSDVPDRMNVKFHETVATVIEDDPSSQDTSNEPEPEPEPQSNGMTAQNEFENDEDNIDIEKEFVMPDEPENNNIVNVLEQSKVSNGGRTMTRMDSNDIIFDGEETPVNGTNKPSTGDEGLDSIMARKALVRQQVQMFEKSSPVPAGEVKYSFRSSAASQEQSAAEAKSEGSNVKNLKNFFQRLSTTPEASTPPSGGAVKPVGKLKVTFPAS